MSMRQGRLAIAAGLLAMMSPGCDRGVFDLDRPAVGEVIRVERASAGELFANGAVADTFVAFISARATRPEITFSTTIGRFHVSGGAQEVVRATPHGDSLLRARVILVAPTEPGDGVVSAKAASFVDWVGVSFSATEEGGS